MATIEINPKSESGLINLINAKELIIEKIEEISDNQQKSRHMMTFIYKNKGKALKECVLQLNKTYDISDYSQFKIKNKNPRFSIKITFNIKTYDVSPIAYNLEFL